MKIICDTNNIDNKDFAFLNGANILSVKAVKGSPYLPLLQIATDKGILTIVLESDSNYDGWNEVIINDFSKINTPNEGE